MSLLWKVVFDAYKAKGRLADKKKTPNGVEVVYTGEGQSADMWMEAEIMELKEKRCPSVMVS
ncbi:unnamed protein product, partial [Choristocarpus tenellus]